MTKFLKAFIDYNVNYMVMSNSVDPDQTASLEAG